MNTLVVSFGPTQEYEFHVSDEELAQQDANSARRWFDREFIDLECSPSNPMGKLLLIDQVLNVAKYAGEAVFVKRGDWANTFARNTLKALGKTMVKIDTLAFSVSY